MQIIKQGAEAILYLDQWENRQVLVKERLKKNYRIDQIDVNLRKTRKRKEVKLLTESRKIGVMTPKILHIRNDKIIMEYLDGVRVKELLNSSNKKTIQKICLQIGRLIGKLHENGIVHGDLTTSNMILKNDVIYFIDFGLGGFSKRIEDQGVDLNLLQEAIKSTHFKILKIAWDNMVKGYRKEYKNADLVLNKLEEIQKRARYMER